MCNNISVQLGFSNKLTAFSTAPSRWKASKVENHDALFRIKNKTRTIICNVGKCLSSSLLIQDIDIYYVYLYSAVVIKYKILLYTI